MRVRAVIGELLYPPLTAAKLKLLIEYSAKQSAQHVGSTIAARLAAQNEALVKRLADLEQHMASK